MTWLGWAAGAVLLGYALVLFLLGPRVEDNFPERTQGDGE